MANLDTQTPSRTYRGTWDEILTHSSEISKTSEVELRVYEPKSPTATIHEPNAHTATMALMQKWLQEDAQIEPEAAPADPQADASIALLQSWLEEDATDDPDEIRQAEEELLEFKRNMNLPRKEAGARLHYPEAE